MVAAFIFLLHGILAVYAFFSQKHEPIGERFLAVAFVGIVFSVGWVMTNMATDALFHIPWFHEWYWHLTDTKPLLHAIQVKEFRQDTLSLLLLTFCEVLFYYFFFLPRTKKPEHREESPKNSD
ncbi:MAG TPA: hypothetical protein VMU30_05610 [Bacteroidota bacterium]|nr:hypothetical protein [Bacteroidota bacterium]